jgi:AcrR family transcriptional regulator
MTGTIAPESRPMRADARRNVARLLEVARETFAERGADAPLEEIARRAGVGIGTLYRHFPTREALLEALLRDSFEALRAEADRLLTSPAPGEALDTWLRAFASHATTYNGLVAALNASLRDEGSGLCTWCRTVNAAGGELLARAQAAGVVRPDITADDMLILANAITWATEQACASPTQAERIHSLVMDSLRYDGSKV